MRDGRLSSMLRRLSNGAELERFAARLDALEAGFSDIKRPHGGDDGVAALGIRLDDLVARNDTAHVATEARLGELGRSIQVRTVMDWIDRATLTQTPLISVILPTRDRQDFLPRAIASVAAQTYTNWELRITDDGSVDDTPDVLSKIDDPKVFHIRGDGKGACAARNLSMSRARGDIIAYLDDDNVMHPNWLKSVAWGFEQRPSMTTLYGAFVVDDTARINPLMSGDLPRLYFFPYDHHAVAINNIADIGCIAHRAGLPDARFDESLVEMGDWDLFLRLTRDAAPLALPAIACYYTTDAPHRLSCGPTHLDDLAAVRSRNAR